METLGPVVVVEAEYCGMVAAELEYCGIVAVELEVCGIATTGIEYCGTVTVELVFEYGYGFELCTGETTVELPFPVGK